jgi:hypothetical protein
MCTNDDNYNLQYSYIFILAIIAIPNMQYSNATHVSGVFSITVAALGLITHQLDMRLFICHLRGVVSPDLRLYRSDAIETVLVVDRID